jgi:hypothetical protein
MKTYWVVRHAFTGSYLTGMKRWGEFENAVPFTSKDGALLYSDTMHPGVTQVLAVEETAPEHLSIPEVLTDWFKLQLQHHQGMRLTEHVA